MSKTAHLMRRIVNKAQPSGSKDLHSLFSTVAEGWAERRDPVASIPTLGPYIKVAGFDTLEKIRNMVQLYRSCLSSVPGFKKSTGCDLGCWLGFSTVTQASLGCRMVYGIDIREHIAIEAESWRRTHGPDNVRFRAMHDGVVPLMSGSVDWVVMNQVLCNALPDSFDGSLREAHRILRPGGRLIFSDANNPYCPGTRERLLRNFHRAEIGSGTLEQPDGPNYLGRRRMMAKTGSGLSDDELDRFARETCYMWGEDLVRAASRFREDGRTPESCFAPDSLRPTLIPGDGASNGNPTDPFRLCARMEEIGFIDPFVTRTPLPTPPDDNEALWSQITESQGFFIFAQRKTTS